MNSPQEDKTFEHKQVIEISASGSETTDSLCTPCKREMSGAVEDKEEGNNEHPDDVLDDLLEASKSLSQVSIQDNDIDFQIDQETLYDLENKAHLSRPKDSKKSSQELATAEQINEYSSLEKSNDLAAAKVDNTVSSAIDDVSSDESDFYLRLSSLHQNTVPQPSTIAPQEPQVSTDEEEPPQKRLKLPEEVSSEKTTEVDDNTDDWDTDFPPEAELQKIDDTVRALTHNNLEESLLKRGKESCQLPEVNYEEITEKIISRKREFMNLVDNVYEASCYLGRIKEILATAPPSGPVTIPPPPKPSGYEQQFDFPDRSRFPKLPITVASSGSFRNNELKENHLPKSQLNASSTLGKSRRSTRRIGPINSTTILKPLSAKSMKNRIEVALPNRFKKQPTIEEMFGTGNKENEKTARESGKSTESFEKDTISDSGSMYNFNPLVRARKPTK
ncbi:uncharacterized protein LOC135167991 [Diachasmimorpha longicaudata]|uniref:uncharacterized protein LOC135167991 n=1 Tax=Diachasmimorpha longicaudata TaxID=58733 RepID=UPI0030B9065A